MEAGAVPRAAPAGVSGIQPQRLLRLSSDAHLVALIRQGRRGAFEAAYDRHQRSILSFCRHMLGELEEAEDAVQHTFLAAYNDLLASDKPIHLRAWLFTIARNRCYSILRARREHPTGDLEEPATEGLAAQVQRRQDLRDLVLDMQNLPEEQRAALVLAELDSLSHEQIGLVLGVPREKVKALVFQARESLLASRTARETDCAEIREQLANMRGGALRRGNLRRHLRECQGCRDFRKQVERQRRQLAMLIPVAPTIALKDGVMGGTAGSTIAIGAAGGGLLASSAIKGAVVKSILAAALAGVGAAGAIVAAHDVQVPARPLTHHAGRLSPAAPIRSAAGPSVTRAPAAVGAASAASVTLPAVTSSRGSASGVNASGSWTRLALMNPVAPVFPTSSPFRTGRWSHRSASRHQATAVAAPLSSTPAATPTSPATSQPGRSIFPVGSPAGQGSVGGGYPSSASSRNSGTVGGGSSSGFPGVAGQGSPGDAGRHGNAPAATGTSSSSSTGMLTGQPGPASASPTPGSGSTATTTPTVGPVTSGGGGNGSGQPGSDTGPGTPPGWGGVQPPLTSTSSGAGAGFGGEGISGAQAGQGSGSDVGKGAD